MKTSITCVVLLSCIALAASFAVDLNNLPSPRSDTEQCASTCLWVGVYAVPSFQSCDRYIFCVHGFQFDLACDAGEQFDHVTLACQPANAGRCILEGPVV